MELIYDFIVNPNNLIYALGTAFVIQLAIYFGVCGYIVVGNRAMYQWFKIGLVLDERELKPDQIRGEIGSSLVICVVYAGYLVLCCRLSSGIYPQSGWEVIWQMFAFLLFYDFLNYFTHRVLHSKRFGRIHRHHHASIRVTPWSSSSLHPAEAVLNQIPFVLFVLLVPVSSLTIIAFYVFFMFGMANAHGNYSIIGNWSGFAGLKRFLRFHQRHHEFGNVNYGFAGTHWDFVFGTHYQENSHTVL